MSTPEQELLAVSEKLLQCIDGGDWDGYAALCDERLTCFEAEAKTHLVVGMPFHKFYFDLPPSGQKQQSTIASPHITVVGDVGIVCYTRLVQRTTDNGPTSSAANETRVWRRDASGWKLIHCHRS
ncbi:MAG: DUF4440 domain-containing protein [Planctomycetaceae bacterium]|nr:DUF4440 domain-containing protein [Planctomycetaceae bacterium]MCA9045922.1 DUF4440 domain-containing protein [Planctomycetaceae bacterium]